MLFAIDYSQTELRFVLELKDILAAEEARRPRSPWRPSAVALAVSLSWGRS